MIFTLVLIFAGKARSHTIWVESQKGELQGVMDGSDTLAYYERS